MRCLLTWILPWLALSAAIFLSWMNPWILDPYRVAWLLDGNDHGQAVIGLAAYLRSPPPWPSLHTSLLMAPDGIPLALTDSNPLLALLLRPFAALLPVGIQYLGWWLFTCVLLHTGIAAALLRRHMPGPLSTWIGAGLLTLTPVFLARFGHVNLCAQWLILWALWIYLDPVRSMRLRWWIAVLIISMLIHPYILVMVTAIWASAMLRNFVQARGGRARVAVLGDIGTCGASLVLALLFVGTLNKPTVSVGGYGTFSMALDALWNPNRDTYSALLPARALDQSQALEGMNYMGAGLLALAAIALLYSVRHIARTRTEPLMRRLVWLLPAFAVLTLLAVAPHLIWRGTIIASLPLSNGLADALSPLRAAGRLFWPVLYTLDFAAIVIVARLRFGPWLLAAALVLQIADMRPLLGSARESTGAAALATPYHRTRDPRWDAVIAQADMIQFEPPEAYRDLALLEEVTWRAIIAGKPVRFFYASRETVATRRRLTTDSMEFAMGQLNSRRLYVLLDGKVPPTLGDRIRKLDGVTIIPPQPLR